MILFELTGTEANPIYQALEIANGNRQYDFLRSIVLAALETNKLFLSQHVIKALNYHAITCLHVSPGEYRPCPVYVGEGEGKFTPPEHYQVNALMDDFVNEINRNWERLDPVVLASFVLWRLNYIHPFINGNGRTARAAAYFVICLASKAWLPGEVILPELLRRNRDEYVQALKDVDASMRAGAIDLSALHGLVTRLLSEQMAPFITPSPAPSTSSTPE